MPKTVIVLRSNAEGTFLTIDGKRFNLTGATDATLASVARDIVTIKGIK